MQHDDDDDEKKLTPKQKGRGTEALETMMNNLRQVNDSIS